MNARRPGTCPATGRAYPAGTEIRKTSLGWTLATVTDEQVAAIVQRDADYAAAQAFDRTGLREGIPGFERAWNALSFGARKCLDDIAQARSERACANM